MDDEKPWELFNNSNLDKLNLVLAQLVVMVQDIASAGTIFTGYLQDYSATL